MPLDGTALSFEPGRVEMAMGFEWPFGEREGGAGSGRIEERKPPFKIALRLVRAYIPRFVKQAGKPVWPAFAAGGKRERDC